MIGSGGCLTMRRLDLGAAQHSRHSGHEATLPSTVCCARMPTTVTTHARAAPQVEGMGLDIACTFNAAFEGLDLQARGAGEVPPGGLPHDLPLIAPCGTMLQGVVPARPAMILTAPFCLATATHSAPLSWLLAYASTTRPSLQGRCASIRRGEGPAGLVPFDMLVAADGVQSRVGSLASESMLGWAAGGCRLPLSPQCGHLCLPVLEHACA